MVKTFKQNPTDDPGKMDRLAAGGRKRGELKRMEKLKKTAGRHNYVENGPAWGDSDIADSDGSMEISQDGGKMRDKRENTFAGTSTKRIRSNEEYKKGLKQKGQEGLEFKIILRFGERRGNFVNGSGEIDNCLEKPGRGHCSSQGGNLMIGCKNKEQRERAGRIKEIGRFKVISTSQIERGSKWSKGVIWGVPVGVTMEEIKSNLKGGSLKGCR